MDVLKKLVLAVITVALVITLAYNSSEAAEVKPTKLERSILSESDIFDETIDLLTGENHFVDNINEIFPEPILKITSNSESEIEKVEFVEAKETEETQKITDIEYDLLARLVVSESKGEPYSGKVAVANVVLKRVESNEFPNTIREVIYQPGQFQVVSNGLIDRRKPSEKSKTAVTEALNTDNGDSLYFYNPKIATNRWLDQLTTVEVIGDHTFKK